MGRLTALVLGSAAGGGFPQWNCRCPVCRLAWAGDARVRPRTQAGLAVTGNGEDWVLINASPDFPAKPPDAPNDCIRATGTRGSPIEAVVLTGGEIDQVAGLLSLREREAFAIFATEETLQCSLATPCSGCWRPALWSGARSLLEEPFTLPGGIEARLFAVPGKLPLYLEGVAAENMRKDRPPMWG